MRLYSYVVARDYGFAPNPFHGWCTLATCKPGIRGRAALGDWIVGTGAKTKYDYIGRLIYAMKVREAVDFDVYWGDTRFQCKKPILNGSLIQLYGDNIYHVDDNGTWLQADSHHSLHDGQPNWANIRRDTGVNRVLVAEKYVYYGADAPRIPDDFLDYNEGAEGLCACRGYKCNYSTAFVEAFMQWLVGRKEWGLRGLPLEFKTHRRAN
jgi:hypothetical protein